MIGTCGGVRIFMITFFVLNLFAGMVHAETKLDYRQRQAVQRQEWNMTEVEKKIAAGVAGEQVQWTQNKLDAILADLQKNNCPDDNAQVSSLKERVNAARTALGGAAVAVETEINPSSAPEPTPPEAVKLAYNARQAVERQERNMTDIEKKIAAGDILINGSSDWLVGKLDAVLADLAKNNAPTDHPQVLSLRERVAGARAALSAKVPAPTAEPVVAETQTAAPAAKLPYSARQAVERQERNLTDIEAKVAAGDLFINDSTNWLVQKLTSAETDLQSNKAPEDHGRVIALRQRIAKVREQLATAESGRQAEMSTESTAPAATMEAKLPYNAREALKRQERNLADFEKKLAEGKVAVYANQLDAMLADLERNRAPMEHSRIRDFLQRVEQARVKLAAAPVPLDRNAKEAVNYQWGKVKQAAAQLPELEAEIAAAPVLKKWDDMGIAAFLATVEGDLQTNHVPTDHPHYLKIVNGKEQVLARLEELKAMAQPKIDAYASSTSLENYPDIQEDSQRAEALLKMYRGASVSSFTNPEKARPLLSQAGQVEQFIAECRAKYAPLVANNIPAGKNLETDLKQLERKFAEFQAQREQFNNSVAGDVRSQLGEAERMIGLAQERRNPQIFTGGVQQAMGKARALVAALAMSKGENDAGVRELNGLLAASQQKVDAAAKVLEEEILADTKAPEDQFQGKGASDLKKTMRKAWEKNYPDDKIMDIRIVSQDWEHSSGYEWNSAYSRWEQYDKQSLNMVVIVETDKKVATIYPAFINRDNMKNKEWTVAAHETDYVVRRMLVKNVR